MRKTNAAQKGGAEIAQLIFIEDDHTYTVNGATLPSVSEIIRFLSKEIYGAINQYVLDNAANRGRRVHKATEVLDKFKEVECDQEIVPYVNAYVNFLKDHTVLWSLIEKSMYHPELLYAGTIDRAGIIDGEFAIVDIKAQEAIKKPLVSTQLNGYADMLEACEHVSVNALYCLQLTNDGKYRLHKIERNNDTFMACYTLHKALEKKPRKRAKDVQAAI